MDFGIGRYVFHGVLLIYDVTRLGVKDKLVVSCGEHLKEGSIPVYLVGTSTAFQILRIKFP